jgi:hypothetical protein
MPHEEAVELTVEFAAVLAGGADNALKQIDFNHD